MKKTLTVLAFVLLTAGVLAKRPMVVQAQTLPYQLTVAWDASPDAVTYTCYLDGTAVVTGVAALTCSFPVQTTGQHTVAVTAVNPAFVPNESLPTSLTFTLKTPASAKNVRVK